MRTGRRWFTLVLVTLAIGCTKSEVTLSPELEAKFSRATTLVRTDDKAKFAEADRLFAEVIAGAPKYEKAVYWRAQLLIAWSDTLLEEAVYLSDAKAELAKLAERARANTEATEPDAKAFAQVLVTSITERHDKVAATLDQWTKDAETHQKSGLDLVRAEITGKEDVPYQAHRILADYYRIIGEHGQAQRELDAVRAMKPDSSGLKFVTGVMLMRAEKKDLDGALAKMDQALAGDPEFIKALYFKGMALAEKGEREAAEKIMRSVLDKSPGHLGAKTYLQVADYVHQATQDLEKQASVK